MRGRLQVYTGNGKGKTTAALGLAVRAACAGLRVYIGQFMKGTDYSELCLPRLLSGRLKMEQYGTPRLICRGEEPGEDDIAHARKGLSRLRDALLSGDYDLVVADELSVTVHMGLLDVAEAMEVVLARPDEVEMVVTGRYAPPPLLEAADLVTEMREVRHYYATEGLEARKGIEY
jgi:cob(I)alamin adenosyltransferase